MKGKKEKKKKIEKKKRGKKTHRLRRPPNPRTQHIHARREHIDPSAIIRKPRARVIDIRRAHGAHARLARRRIVLRIVIAIPRRHAKKHARLDRGRRSTIHGITLPRPQAHICDIPLRALPGGSPLGAVGRDKVDAGDDARQRARAGGVEDLDGEEARFLGDAVGDAPDGAGHVRAVAVPVRVGVAGVVGQPGGAAGEFLDIR